MSNTSAYVACAEAAVECSFEPNSPGFLDTIRKVRALTVMTSDGVPTRQRALAEVRGYARSDLFAIAEVGYHLLMNGAVEVGFILFDGLSAVAPTEPYFALALGLAHDLLGNRDAASECYARAAALDRSDPLPDVNGAELLIAGGNHTEAQALLRRAIEKARAKPNQPLERKAVALLAHISRHSLPGQAIGGRA